MLLLSITLHLHHFVWSTVTFFPLVYVWFHKVGRIGWHNSCRMPLLINRIWHYVSIFICLIFIRLEFEQLSALYRRLHVVIICKFLSMDVFSVQSDIFIKHSYVHIFRNIHYIEFNRNMNYLQHETMWRTRIFMHCNYRLGLGVWKYKLFTGRLGKRAFWVPNKKISLHLFK